MTTRTLGIVALLALGAGCTVELDGPDGRTSQDDPIDPDPESPTVPVSGRVLDYFAKTPLAAATLETLGLEREQFALSGDDGDYLLAKVPEASAFFVQASAGIAYRDTLDDSVYVDAEATVRDMWLVSRGDTERQHATVGIQLRDEASMIVLELARLGGAPLEGVAREDITLRDDAGTSVASAWLVGALGDVDPELATTSAVDGHARAIFLDVPEGIYTLAVDCRGCAPRTTIEKAVAARAGGVTLTRLEVADGAAGSATFDDVYRIVQRGSDGGSGCANCHTADGAASLLVLDQPADDLYALLASRADLVDVAAPADSLLLTKPLYETPANHPNATWLDTQHRDYQTILAWISAGATR